MFPLSLLDISIAQAGVPEKQVWYIAKCEAHKLREWQRQILTTQQTKKQAQKRKALAKVTEPGHTEGDLEPQVAQAGQVLPPLALLRPS